MSDDFPQRPEHFPPYQTMQTQGPYSFPHPSGSSYRPPPGCGPPVSFQNRPPRPSRGLPGPYMGPPPPHGPPPPRPYPSHPPHMPHPTYHPHSPQPTATPANEKADDNPWPSGEELHEELKQEAQTSGGSVDIMSSRKRRDEYIRRQPHIPHKTPIIPTTSDHSMSSPPTQPRHSSPPALDRDALHATAVDIPAVPPGPVPRHQISALNGIEITHQKWGSKEVVVPVTAPALDGWDEPSAPCADAIGNSTRQWADDVGDAAASAELPDNKSPSRAFDAPPDVGSPELPMRPDSSQPCYPRQTVYISDEEDEFARQTEPATVRAVSPLASAPLEHHHDRIIGQSYQPSVVSRSDSTQGRQRSGRGYSQIRRRESKGRDWRRPHSLRSPHLADRQLLVSFPYPIREESVVPALRQHFARYGTIKACFPLGVNNGQGNQGMVVFEHPHAVENCLSDPQRNAFTFRSGHTPLTSTSVFEVTITRPSPLGLGPQGSHRSRSASPTRSARNVSRRQSVFELPHPRLPLPQKPPPSGFLDHHHLLRREILYMYKDGRPVVLEQVGVADVYVDKRAIHIGRLVKEKETKSSLLERFRRYGEVANIEYNPTPLSSTYATARILYHDRESAVRAREHEDGRVSFGSAIKVSERIVQHADVRMQEVLVDPIGNVVSSAAAEQYSPPTPNSHFRRTDWIPPPPLPSFFAPTPPTAPPFLPPPMSFPTSSLVMMPMLYGQPWNPPYMGIPPQVPPAFPVPIPGGYPEPPRDPVDGLISGMQAMGVFCPPLWYGVQPPSAPSQRPHPSPPMTPVHSAPPILSHPPNETFAPYLGATSQGGLPTPPTQAGDLPITSIETPISPPGYQGPRVVGIKFVDGEFKPEYHPDDLQRWYEAKGLEKPRYGGAATGKETESTAEQGQAAEHHLIPVPVPFSPSQAPAPLATSAAYPKIPRIPVPREV